FVDRPFVRMATTAESITAPEYFFELAVGDTSIEHIYDSHASACMRGAGGGVDCLRTCEAGLESYHVSAPPAREVRADRDRGYIIGDDGSLWTWIPPESRGCWPKPSVAAPRVRLPAVVKPAEPLVHAGPYPHWEQTRCALTAEGPRCWLLEYGKPIAPFDPAHP